MKDIAERLRAREHFDTWNDEFVSKKAADEIERLREENQRQKEKIMLLNSLVQTEHHIIRVAALKEDE